MKVALVNPPRIKSLFTDEQIKLCESTAVQISEEQVHPLEFAYISALLKDAEVAIFDAHSLKWPFQKLIKHIKDFNPDFIGIPSDVYSNSRCPIPFYPHVTETIRLVREEGLKSKFIIWGAHSTIFPHQVIQETGADIVIRGEPEITFVKTILNIENLKDIRGISYREGSEIIDNSDAESLDLNALPLPDYASLNLKNYSSPLLEGENYFLVSASRGCPYSCVYCAKDIIGKYRERKIELVIKELELLKDNGVSTFGFSDEVFTLKKERTMKICKEMLERGLDMKWRCQTRPELLDEDLFKIMKDAGCEWIGIGFESASEEILKRIGKKPDLENTKRCIELGKKYGITVNLFTMSFLPGESRETLDETMQFIKKNRPDIISTTITTPMPGTKLWREGLKSGVLKTGYWGECLQKAGQVGVSEFTTREIEEYRRLFPAEVALSNKKLLFNKLKNSIKNPDTRLHYLKKLGDLLKYKIRNFLRILK